MQPSLILVLPAAGRGTRMREVAGDLPKELLPLAGKTVIDWAAEELPEAQLAVVGSPDKPAITEWAQARQAQIALQQSANGFAPAIAPFLSLGYPTALALPDTLYWPESPLRRMTTRAHEADILIAVEDVPDDKVSRYGICEADPSGRLLRILEKPEPHETLSRQAISARYVFSPQASSWMGEWIASNLPAEGELSMTPVFNAALGAGFSGMVVPLLPQERRLDCGSPDGYREAQEALRGTLPA